MTDHEDHTDGDRTGDAEHRRQIALEEFRKLRGKYAHEHEGPDPAGERSEAIRRLLTADDPYEGLGGMLELDRDLGRGNLDIAALARRRLRVLRSVKVRELENPLCTAVADLVIEAMASRLVFEAAMSAESCEVPAGTSSQAGRDWLAAAVENLGDDDVYDLLAMAVRHSGHPDQVAELRRDLGL